ncbi:MAG: cytochrome c [Xanthomonadales bacterium]|nr:cytochrome c [Xanthomonadales bacterium]
MNRPKLYLISTSLVLVLITSACSRVGTEDIPARAMTCVGCHGGNGMVVAPAMPRLAGQSAIYLSKQLRAYKDGSRKDPIMSALAEALSNEEIDSITAYYESLDPCEAFE